MVMAGDELVITAGLGAYNQDTKPTVTIDGASVPLNADGQGVYKTITSSAGDFTKHVTVTYKDPASGEVKSKSTDVKYKVGIPTGLAGDLSFAMAALIGAVSGLLIAPLTTVYYDTGFLIGLKGFVAAILGALVSYPLAVAGALLVGLLEAYASFWASAFKEVMVFTLIIPVLWWRSVRTHHVEEDE
jgi:hypothetical protein